jgi:hypothetical protein
MENSSIIVIGMDTHKQSTDVSYALEGRENRPQHLGKIASRKQAVQKLVRQCQSKYPGATLHYCYEAGPCGYCITRPHSISRAKATGLRRRRKPGYSINRPEPKTRNENQHKPDSKTNYHRTSQTGENRTN